MNPGLSDADRERMRRAGGRAERKMARDRQRVHERLAAERRRIEEPDGRDVEERAHRERFGPPTITGPDGVAVLLEVRLSGGARFTRLPPSRSGALGLAPELSGWGVNIVSAAALWQAVTRSCFVLFISAHGLQHRHRRIYIRDEGTAERMFAQAVAVVRSGGVTGLNQWAAY